jgi:thymidylate synthase
MISSEFSEQFGHQIYGDTIGEMWMGLVKAVVSAGAHSFDESRERLALSNLRVKSATQIAPDQTLEKYCDGAQLKAMIDFMFEREVMEDIDVVKSFSPGAKSYRKRIKEGRLVDFVIERLSLIPESKKAAIVFPTYDDYAAVMRNHGDDYMPCLVSIHFRLAPTGFGYVLNTTFFSRSMDVWQKGHGNFLSVAMLSDHIAKALTWRLSQNVALGFLDGMIADGHIYEEKYAEARKKVEQYDRDMVVPA